MFSPSPQRRSRGREEAVSPPLNDRGGVISPPSSPPRSPPGGPGSYRFSEEVIDDAVDDTEDITDTGFNDDETVTFRAREVVESSGEVSSVLQASLQNPGRGPSTEEHSGYTADNLQLTCSVCQDEHPRHLMYRSRVCTHSFCWECVGNCITSKYIEVDMHGQVKNADFDEMDHDQQNMVTQIEMERR